MTRPQKGGENDWDRPALRVISSTDPATGTGALTEYFRTRVTKIGPEALELVEGAILILFPDDAPPELAEVAVLHRVENAPTEEGPAVGAQLKIGDVSARLTAIGDHAWKKIADIGHVVIYFNGADVTPRPGEICAAEVDLSALASALSVGAEISIRA
jgi:PTS system glucitol/sorbitol-specific IIA component